MSHFFFKKKKKKNRQMDFGEKKKDHDINKGSFYIKDLCKLFFFSHCENKESIEMKQRNQQNSVACDSMRCE
jgi:hypothetical protein